MIKNKKNLRVFQPFQNFYSDFVLIVFLMIDIKPNSSTGKIFWVNGRILECYTSRPILFFLFFQIINVGWGEIQLEEGQVDQAPSNTQEAAQVNSTSGASSASGSISLHAEHI
jgi:hypothetical protein